MASAIEIFCCYARKDQTLLQGLKAHLAPLQRRGFITIWNDTDISPGTNWEAEIGKHLNSAHIILLLVSPDFMVSEYCYSVEMKRAIERHESGEARVIPIILRRAIWEDAPFSKLQVLPSGGKAVTHWRKRDDAYWDIAQGIRTTVEDLLKSLKVKKDFSKEVEEDHNYESPSKVAETLDANRAQSYIGRGDALRKLHRYEEALAAYEEAIRLNPSDASAYHGKGNTLGKLNRYQDALAAFEQAIHIDPYDADFYNNKASALFDLYRYDEALIAHEQTIRLDPHDAHYYNNKCHTLIHLRRYEEALATNEQAIQLEPTDADYYNSKGLILIDLHLDEEALAIFEQAIHLDSSEPAFYYNKGLVLKRLNRYEEALTAYEQAIQLAPNDADNYIGKGEVLDKLGYHKAAVEVFEQAANLKEGAL